MNSSFCAFPWNHVSIQPNGKVHSCCWTVSHKELGNLRETSVEDIWNGEEMKEIRKQMLEGKRISPCKRCYEIESAGGVSKRLKANEEHDQIQELAKTTKKDGSFGSIKNLEYLELRFSNVCNFRCRTCGPEFSTAWTKEARALDMPEDKIGLQTPDEAEKLFEMLVPLIPTLKKIYFVGGEPLLAPENYKLLDLLLENNRTDVHLTYDTNFSKLELGGHNVLEDWKFFRTVEVSASLDGFGPQGEFIRKGMGWLTFLENRQRLKTQCPHVSFRVKTTVSILNAFHVLDLLKVILESELVEPDGWFANLVSNPERYNICALPAEYKIKLQESYQKFIDSYLIPNLGKERSANIIGQLNKVIAFSKGQAGPQALPLFFKTTRALDKMRNENFFLLFPEYRDLQLMNKT